MNEAIVLFQGKWLCGRLEGDTLNDVLEMAAGLVPMGNTGKAGVSRGAAPPLLLSSLGPIDVTGCFVKMVADLNGREKTEVLKSMAGGYDMVKELRAAAAGLVLAPNGALPPRRL